MINKLFESFLIILLFSFPTDGYSRTVDFKQFLQSFKDKNPDLKNAILQEAATLERSEAIYSLYIPSLTLGQGYSVTRPIPSVTNTFDLSKSTSQGVGIVGTVPELGLNYSSNLINQNYSRDFLGETKQSENFSNLIDFGVSLKLLKGLGPSVGSIPFIKAKLAKNLAEQERIKALLSGVGGLISAYNNVYASTNNLEISLGILKTNTEDLRKAEKQHKEGVIPFLSLLSIQSQNTNLKKNILGQRKIIRENLLNLYSLSGIAYTEADLENLELAPINMPAEFENIIGEWFKGPFSFRKLNNPDQISKKYGLQISKLDLKAAKNNALPDLSLNAKVIQNSDRRYNYFPYEGHSQEYSITLTMPIGLVSERAEYRARVNELRAKNNDLEQTNLRLRQSWENAGQQYKLSLEQLEITGQLVEVAKKQYQSSLPTATLGPTYQANIINFQNQLLSAQLELNQAKADLLNIMVQIYVLKGDSSFIAYLE